MDTEKYFLVNIITVMEKIKISSAQFENRSGDKEYNLSVIDRLSKKAAG